MRLFHPILYAMAPDLRATEGSFFSLADVCDAPLSVNAETGLHIPQRDFPRMASVQNSRKYPIPTPTMETRFLQFAVIAFLSFSLPSCVLIGNKAVESAHRNIGAELLDLKRAKDQGLLSEEQYRKQHERILADPCKQGCKTKN